MLSAFWKNPSSCQAVHPACMKTLCPCCPIDMKKLPNQAIIHLFFLLHFFQGCFSNHKNCRGRILFFLYVQTSALSHAPKLLCPGLCISDCPYCQASSQFRLNGHRPRSFHRHKCHRLLFSNPQSILSIIPIRVRTPLLLPPLDSQQGHFFCYIVIVNILSSIV